MMKRNGVLRTFTLSFATAGIMAACSLNPKVDPTRYYVLSALSDDPALYESAGLRGASPEEAVPSSSLPVALSIGIGPVTLPAYLKRTRMVTRRANNELAFLETERWAEPLEDALPHALAGNVGLILGAGDMVLFPWYANRQPKYSVSVDVLRFERDLEGAVSLAAQWEIRGPAGEIIARELFRETRPAANQSIAASVNAQSHLVAALSRRIGDALRQVGFY